ncbi:MAG: enoyl-CoA hydratase [Acidimicrobiales bacterium]|nr:enoyl-CoA hydratase [Hyphomonadaceae bacterium]RZV40107.1 MAG: enoyl-CoA hydratase [Acidimicrobiales bacterium]
MSENLKFKMINDHVGELVLSQPKRRNALNAAMWAGLPGILKTAEETKGIKVLIVRGDGDHFASGADISEFETLYATEESARKISDDIAAGFKALAEFPFPVIGLVRGACVGGGCGLALCCDLRFADTTSKFAITPNKLGLVYPFSDVQRLIETVGVPHAKDMLFSARLVLVAEALDMGLINRLCPVDDLENTVLEYALNIASLSTQSAKTTKKMFAAHSNGQRTETIESEAWFLSGFSSRDFQEGYKAFLEKRKPDFK